MNYLFFYFLIIFLAKKYKPTVTEEKSFTAYIIRGNRQVIQREVTASKRFRINEETYIIDPECIFRKNIGGHLRSVSYYREGNPKPYDFQKTNIGLTPTELDRFYAEDFYNIIVNLDFDRKILYMLLLTLVNFVLLLVFVIFLVIAEFLLKGGAG